MLDFSRISQCHRILVERVNEKDRVIEKGEVVGLTIDGQFYDVEVGNTCRVNVPAQELRIAADA